MAEDTAKKLLLIVNPVSGKKMAKRYMMKMINSFDEAGYSVTDVYKRQGLRRTTPAPNLPVISWGIVVPLRATLIMFFFCAFPMDILQAFCLLKFQFHGKPGPLVQPAFH